MISPEDERRYNTLLLANYKRLRMLVVTESDEDAFTDTYLWMREHPTYWDGFIKNFCVRFRLIKIENHSQWRFSPLQYDVADDREPYQEVTSDERASDIIGGLKDAILSEANARKKKKGKRRH